MIWFRALLAMLPTLVGMLLILAMRPLLSTFYIYGPGWLIFLYLGTFLPLLINALAPKITRLHSWTILLPTAPIWLLVFANIGKAVAGGIPQCCTISTWKKFDTSKVDESGERIYFVLGGRGWGNPSSFEFTNASVIYAKRGRQFDLSYIYLPELRGHYTHSYTTNFDITREKLLEYVTKSDDFPPKEAEHIAQELWQALNELIEKTNLPDLEPYTNTEPLPRFHYRATDFSIVLATIMISVPFLYFLSLALTYFELRRRLAPRGETLTAASSNILSLPHYLRK